MDVGVGSSERPPLDSPVLDPRSRPLMRRYPMSHWSFGLVTTLINTIPPRDPDDDDDSDDDEKDDEEVDREPAVIREPDKDE